jgi:hypothetical protein
VVQELPSKPFGGPRCSQRHLWATILASFSKQILGSLIKNRVHFENINNTLINLEEYDVLDFKMKDITKIELYVKGYLTNG